MSYSHLKSFIKMNSNSFVEIDFIYWLLKSVNIAIIPKPGNSHPLYNSKHNLKWHWIYIIIADESGRIEFQILTIKDIW